MSKKSKAKRNTTSVQMKKVLGQSGGLAPLIRKGEWQSHRQEDKRGQDKTRTKSLPVEVVHAMIEDKAGGATMKDIALKYGTSEKYILDSLAAHHLKFDRGKQVLKGVLLTNAIACGMQVKQRMDELTPMQSAVATGIMTRNFIDMDKHTSESQEDIDYSSLSEIGKSLGDISKVLLADADAEGELDASV